MNNETALHDVEHKILLIRNQQVMIDRDLAELYSVETKVLNQAVKRNIERFPERFMFQLSENEYNFLRSQIVTSKTKDSSWSQIMILKKETRGGRQYMPYVFTEQGIAMLSSILRSATAVQVSIRIMDAFVAMRKFLLSNAQVFQRLNTLETKQAITDKKIDDIFLKLEQGNIKPKQGIFFEGQVFDALQFVSDLIKSAKKTIIVIDNYVDDSVLTLLSNKAEGVSTVIFTKTISSSLKLAKEKFNSQYGNLDIKSLTLSHDRFIIIDDKEIYHIGASLKDLGKKWFAFSKIEVSVMEGFLERIKELIINGVGS